MAISKEKFNQIAKWVLVLGGAALISPIIYLSIKGLMGAIAAFVIGSVFIALREPFASALTALKFRSLKTVISYAPVEALEARAAERFKALDEQRLLLTKQIAGVEMLKKKAQKIAVDFPEEQAEMDSMLQQRETLLSARITQFKDTKAKTHKFMRTVDKAKALYEIAVADNELGLNAAAQEEFMNKFKEQVAFEAIDRENAESLANLRMSMAEMDVAPANVPVQAIVYDKDSKVDLGNILNLNELQPVAVAR